MHNINLTEKLTKIIIGIIFFFGLSPILLAAAPDSYTKMSTIAPKFNLKYSRYKEYISAA